MDKTINYSETLQAFMSFMTSRPKWYLDFGDRYFSIDNNNKLRLHNSNTNYNVLSSEKTKKSEVSAEFYYPADQSELRIVINQDYEATKVFDNVFYTGVFADGVNLDNIVFETQTQKSSIVGNNSIDRREDTYRFSIPRSNDAELFGDRMRGKHMLSTYNFLDLEGSKFTLPYIKTTYRYSNI